MDLKKELKKRKDIFEKELKKYLENGTPKTIYDAARHLPVAGGKRLRPCISMLSCEALGGNINKVVPLAISIELIHNFTLVHDDIMDNSKLRRNIPTVHIKFDEPTAIIAGDLLFAKAFEVMHDLAEDISVFKKIQLDFINCIREICEGQQTDMDFEKKQNIKEKEYLEMIRKKTAIIFQFAAESGATIGGGTKKEIQALKDYGKFIGLAFQIHDDYLDMSSDEKILGKDIGNDIRNGKKTLVAVHCINNASGEDKKLLKNIFGNRNATENEVNRIYSLFNKIGSVEYAKKTAINYCNKAKKSLNSIPNSHAKEILLELARYSIKREK
ncbi:MAG: polyprenyl synthetase family protein [Thermoplasmatales archaeon]|nr:MAG: polyprenyl synthetase family protein [Thermoplasmatales archaeon]